MNFLGHFVLAGEDEGLLIGNFIADFVKGKAYQEYPAPIAKGILMHREIDFYTDNHPDFKQSKKRISEKYHHFSGVIIDIFYDHYLAVDFEKIKGKNLETYAQSRYAIIDKNLQYLPANSRHLFTYMKRDNWLKRYEELSGISRTLEGMSRRIKRENQLDEAIHDLQLHYRDMQEDFRRFFEDAVGNFSSFDRNRPYL